MSRLSRNEKLRGNFAGVIKVHLLLDSKFRWRCSFLNTSSCIGLFQHTWTAALIAAALWHAASDLCTEEAPQDLHSAASNQHYYTGCMVACEYIGHVKEKKKRLTRHKLLSSEMRRKSRLWSSGADPIPDLRQLYLQQSSRGSNRRWWCSDEMISAT